MEKFNVPFYEYAKNFKREYVTIIDSIESINSMDLIKMLQELHAEYNPSDLNIRIDFDGYCEPNLLVERLETDAEFNKRVRAKYDYEKARYENAREKREREREQELAKLKQQREKIQAKINALQ